MTKANTKTIEPHEDEALTAMLIGCDDLPEQIKMTDRVHVAQKIVGQLKDAPELEREMMARALAKAMGVELVTQSEAEASLEQEAKRLYPEAYQALKSGEATVSDLADFCTTPSSSQNRQVKPVMNEDGWPNNVSTGGQIIIWASAYICLFLFLKAILA